MAAPASASQLPQTPTSRGIKVPNGHILCSDKWRGTQITKQLQTGVNVLYEDRLGVVDFHPSEHMGVVYVSEGELVASTSYRRKLAKLRMANTVKGVIIAEKTPVTEQYFGALQQFTVLELGMVLLPVASQTEAANLLTQMVHVENRPHANQFRLKRRPPPVDSAVLTTMQLVPRLGEVKARALLDNFGSIKGICDASEEELAAVVGRTIATHVHNFFSQPPTSGT